MARIEEGTYRARAVEGSEQYGQTSKGNDQIVIDLDLETGDRVSTFLFFSEKAAPHSIKRLRACGWKGNDLSDLKGIGAEEVDVRVYYEDYEGKESMKVEIATGGTVVLADKDRYDAKGKAAFAKRFQNLVSSVKPDTKPAQRRAAPPPAQRQATGTDGGYSDTDDEIPF
jgi:hypothetical protein